MNTGTLPVAVAAPRLDERTCEAVAESVDDDDARLVGADAGSRQNLRAAAPGSDRLEVAIGRLDVGDDCRLIGKRRAAGNHDGVCLDRGRGVERTINCQLVRAPPGAENRTFPWC